MFSTAKFKENCKRIRVVNLKLETNMKALSGTWGTFWWNPSRKGYAIESWVCRNKRSYKALVVQKGYQVFFRYQTHTDNSRFARNLKLHSICCYQDARCLKQHFQPSSPIQRRRNIVCEIYGVKKWEKVKKAGWMNLLQHHDVKVRRLFLFPPITLPSSSLRRNK